MNSTQAKKIPLVKILEQLGHSPEREVRGDIWYHSPFRKESEASFKIDTRQNVWFDYGEGEGGNVLDLISYLHNGRKCEASDVSSALGKLVELTGEYKAGNDYQMPDLLARSASIGSLQRGESTLEIVKVQELQNKALTGYLKERGISERIARPHVKEIYYKRGGKNYFALAFPNNSEGYELRNEYFKGVHGTKDISVVGRKEFANEKKIEGGGRAVTVFEGFMDFLSALVHYGKPITTPVIVLNSVAMKDRAVKAIRDMQVSKVYLYTQRDERGIEARNYIAEELKGIDVLDKSDLYEGYEDFNEFLIGSNLRHHSVG